MFVQTFDDLNALIVSSNKVMNSIWKFLYLGCVRYIFSRAIVKQDRFVTCTRFVISKSEELVGFLHILANSIFVFHHSFSVFECFSNLYSVEAQKLSIESIRKANANVIRDSVISVDAYHMVDP